MLQLAQQEEEAVLMSLKNRLEHNLIESVYHSERIYHVHHFDREEVGVIRYTYDATTAIRTLTVKTIYGVHTITEKPSNTKIFDLLYRWLLRVSSIKANEYHDKMMKLLTD